MFSQQLENAESDNTIENDEELEHESSDVQTKAVPKITNVVGTTRKIAPVPMGPVTISVQSQNCEANESKALSSFDGLTIFRVPWGTCPVAPPNICGGPHFGFQSKQTDSDPGPPRANIRPQTDQEPHPVKLQRVDEQTLEFQHASEGNDDEETPCLDPQPDPMISAGEVEVSHIVKV